MSCNVFRHGVLKHGVLKHGVLFLVSVPGLVGVLGLVLLAIPASADELSFVAALEDGADGGDHLQLAIGVAASPDGRHVYVTGRLDDAVTAFERDPASGDLTFIDSWTQSLQQAYGLAVSPDGAKVFIASNVGDAVVVYDRDSASGELSFVAPYSGDGGAVRSVALSPDGRHLYATAWVPGAVFAFEMDTFTGGLSLLESYVEGANGISGLAQAQSVAVSPDGKNVYAVGETSNALVTFRRDEEIGTLTYLGAIVDDTPGVDGLDRPLWVAVSPDGRHVAVASGGDQAVTVFERNQATGSLRWVQIYQGPNMVNAYCVTFSPDGSRLLASAPGSDSLAIFERDAATGHIELLEIQQNHVGGVTGLDGIRQVVVSSDGRNVYTANAVDDTVAVFVLAPVFSDGFESGDLDLWSHVVGGPAS